MENDNFEYYGLFLSNGSKAFYRKYVEDMIKKFHDDAVFYCDHCTLLHCTQMNLDGATELKEFLDEHLGEEFTIKFTMIGSSDKCSAFAVELPQGIKSMNKTPHVTIATFNGGKPFQSNQITNWDKLNGCCQASASLRKITRNKR